MFWFIAYGTRNITVAASFFPFYERFLFWVFRFFVLDQVILLWSALVSLYGLKKDGCYFSNAGACFTLWLGVRKITFWSALVLPHGLYI